MKNCLVMYKGILFRLNQAKNLTEFVIFHPKKGSVIVGLMISSAIIKVALNFIPFKHIQAYLGQKMRQDIGLLTDDQRQYVNLLKENLKIASTFFPWGKNCLNQAILGKILLRRRNISSTLHLGVMDSTNPESLFAAHAWLSVGPDIVCGESSNSYVLLVCFN